MNKAEFEDNTTMRCFICEEVLKTREGAPDKQVYYCECEAVTVIFKNTPASELLYYSMRLPNYAGAVILSRPNEKHQFMVTVSSWNQSITFRTDHILSWFQDEHCIKRKIDSLMILK